MEQETQEVELELSLHTPADKGGKGGQRRGLIGVQMRDPSEHLFAYEVISRRCLIITPLSHHAHRHTAMAPSSHCISCQGCTGLIAILYPHTISSRNILTPYPVPGLHGAHRVRRQGGVLHQAIPPGDPRRAGTVAYYYTILTCDSAWTPAK